MEMDQLREPDDVDVAASAVVDGTSPPDDGTDPAVRAAAAELAEVRRRVGRVEAGDPAALSRALDVAFGSSGDATHDGPAPEVVVLDDRRRRRSRPDVRRILAGAAAAVVVLVAVAGGVVATRDGGDQDELSSAADSGSTSKRESQSTTTVGAVAAPAAPGVADAPTQESGYAQDGAGVVPVPVEGPELGAVSSLDELRDRAAAADASSEHHEGAAPSARSSRMLACPPQALSGLVLIGSAVLDGTPVAVVRASDGTVSALTLATCAPVG